MLSDPLRVTGVYHSDPLRSFHIYIHFRRSQALSTQILSDPFQIPSDPYQTVSQQLWRLGHDLLCGALAIAKFVASWGGLGLLRLGLK